MTAEQVRSDGMFSCTWLQMTILELPFACAWEISVATCAQVNGTVVGEAFGITGNPVGFATVTGLLTGVVGRTGVGIAGIVVTCGW